MHRPEAGISFQIIATLGPASWGKAAALLSAGATSLRVNSSHLPSGELSKVLESVMKQAPDVNVVVDLQGAKLRIGEAEHRIIVPGDVVDFRLGHEAGDAVPVPHPELFAAVTPGDTLTLDDGRLRLRVEESEADRLRARVLQGGRVLPRKGVNVAEHPVMLDRLTDRDRGFLEDARSFGAVSWAYSFMLDGREAAWVREAAPEQAVVGKVERIEACRCLGELASRVDEVWICRGDLGEQVGWAALGAQVASVVPGELPVPVLMAGQVLEHLTHHRLPTRSEICHLYDLVARGYAGIVLSDETAVGADPVGAVMTARELASDCRRLARGV